MTERTRSSVEQCIVLVTAIGAALAFPLEGMAQTGDAKRPPNILIILADDLGYSDVGSFGSEVATPNIDRLAAEGIRFTQFYNTARCWSSRAALLTGYYAQQVNRDPAGQRPKWAALLPELLKPAGYHSYHSGKWHVDGPVLAGGFERSYEVSDPDRHFGPKQHHLDDQPLQQPKPTENYYTTTAIARNAINWIGEHDAKHREKPFFLYLAFLSPHFPIQALPDDIARYRDRYANGWDIVREERFKRQQELGIVTGNLSVRDPKTIPSWNLSEAELKQKLGTGEVGYAVPWKSLNAEQRSFQATKMAVHAAMVDRMDQEIGQVIVKLKSIGQFNNTIILFASDNGASAEQIIRGDGHDQHAPAGSAKTFLSLGPGWSTAANTPFRLHKSWTHEGGISTPLIVTWPAGIPARGELRHSPGHLVDIVPTLLTIAGIHAPESWAGEQRPPLSGRSLVPVFAEDVMEDHNILFFKHIGNRALRQGHWKIVAAGPDSAWELYDLSQDRSESHNLAGTYPERVKKLAVEWEKRDRDYMRQGATGAPLPSGDERTKALRRNGAKS